MFKKKPKSKATVDRSNFYTTGLIGKTRETTPEGYLLCRDVPIARIGKLIYGDGEVPITADDKNITIERHIPAEVTAFTYPALIEQCIHILIDNAVRYTPRNGTINILLDKTKSIVLLKIENSGRGISEYDLPKIFDRFFRSDTSRTDGGHGLGLSIAKTGIEKLGGSIEVISIENKKTIFTVKIPV